MSRLSRLPVADLVSTVAFAVMFLGCYLLSRPWDFRSALMPRLVSVVGLVLAVVHLVVLLIRAGRAEPAMSAAAALSPAGAGAGPGLPSGTADPSGAVSGSGSGSGFDGKDGPAVADEADDWDAEYVFATAGRTAWLSALFWIVLFFGSLGLFGLVITLPLFAFGYLRFAGGVSWLSSAVYALCAGTLVYLVFDLLLEVGMPVGIFS